MWRTIRFVGTQVDTQPPVLEELAEVGGSMDREITAIVAALDGPSSTPGETDPATRLPEHGELVRQLGALRDRVARASAQIGNPSELRAELATLLFFARTLRADAERLRATVREALEEIVRAEAAARLERERLVAEREAALHRRDVLQEKIVRTAEGIAEGDETECRPTVPVIRLGEGVTVCSMDVATPKRIFRSRQFWSVTLTDARDDVLARRT